MRIVGSTLMTLGLLVGLADGVLILTGGDVFGVSWIASVALAKLIFVSSLGLLSAGAVVRRLANRDAIRSMQSENQQLGASGQAISNAYVSEASKEEVHSPNAIPVEPREKDKPA